MRWARILSVLFLLLPLRAEGALLRAGGGGIGSPPPPISDEEFVGPFASWICAQASGPNCGAAAAGFCNTHADGTTNDVSLLQACFNLLSAAKPVIWFPAAIYAISEISATASAPSTPGTALTVSSPSGTIVQNMYVSCTNVPTGDWVASISGTSVTLGLATTGVVSGTCLFGLNLYKIQYVSLIGHSPADTILKWTGSTGGTMLIIDGVTQSTFGRLTFDGNNLASILVDQAHYDLSPPGTSYFDTNNQYPDDVFKNGAGALSYGLRCGGGSVTANAVNGCSETEVIRNSFSNLTVGFAACNSNSVDEWLWYSQFSSNAYAANSGTVFSSGGTDYCYSGVIHAIGNTFTGSSQADIYSHTSGQMALIGNYSTGSNQFINAPAGQYNVQGNQIINTTQPLSLYLGEGNGKILVDNKILTKAGNAAPVVNGAGRLIMVGNTYTIGTTGTVYSGFSSTYQVDDAIGTVTPAPPTLPPLPPNNGRTIFEASPTGTAGPTNTTCSLATPCTPQAAVCMAATGSTGFSAGACTGTVNSNKSVAHLQPGNYTPIAATIAVPANSNIQIIGDGWSSSLLGGTGVTPVVKINGPSQVVLRNFAITAATGDDGIDASGIDQAGAIIYLSDVFLGGSAAAHLNSSLNNALIEAHDFQYPGPSTLGIQVTGNNKTHIFMGVSTSLRQNFAISGSGEFYEVGGWEDGQVSGSTIYATVSGTGNFAEISSNIVLIDASNIYSVPPSGTFTGKLVAVADRVVTSSCTTNGLMTFSGTQTGAQEIVGGNPLPLSTSLNNTATGNQTSFIGNLANACGTETSIADSFTNISGPTDAPFFRSVLAPFRAAMPILPHALPAGTTNIEMYRVNVSASGNNILLSP